MVLIDVSAFQGVVDWKKVVAEGWQFAILKVIRKDGGAEKQFAANWQGCQDAGMRDINQSLEVRCMDGSIHLQLTVLQRQLQSARHLIKAIRL